LNSLSNKVAYTTRYTGISISLHMNRAPYSVSHSHSDVSWISYIQGLAITNTAREYNFDISILRSDNNLRNMQNNNCYIRVVNVSVEIYRNIHI